MSTSQRMWVVGFAVIFLAIFFASTYIIQSQSSLPEPPAEFGEWYSEHLANCNLCGASIPLPCKEKSDMIRRVEADHPDWKMNRRFLKWAYKGKAIEGFEWDLKNQQWKKL